VSFGIRFPLFIVKGKREKAAPHRRYFLLSLDLFVCLGNDERKEKGRELLKSLPE